MTYFSARTLKMLWGRAAARCSMPECHQHLVQDATASDDEALVGDNCHIVAESPDGPRGDASFPTERLDKYGNLILLCKVHHGIIDAQPRAYTVERLHEIKGEHEEWVRNSLSDFDPTRQADDERYAAIIDEWVRRCHIETWKAWTSWVLGSSSSLGKEIDSDLEEAREWLLNRFWPGRYPELEDALQNFRRVLADFHNTFHEHAQLRGDQWCTEKFYKLQWHKDEEVYNKLVEEWEAHIALVDDLCCELTRAANQVLKIIRKGLVPTFREDAGLLTIQRGPDMQLKWRTYVPQYTPENLLNDPVYPGIDEFLEILPTRDFYFSELPKAEHQKQQSSSKVTAAHALAPKARK